LDYYSLAFHFPKKARLKGLTILNFPGKERKKDFLLLEELKLGRNFLGPILGSGVGGA